MMNELVKTYDLGEGQPLIFQHGLAANFNQIIKLLSPLEKLRLLGIDCPGHGMSFLNKGLRPSFSYYGQKVMEMLNEKGLDSAVFGGLSMGAGIATYIAIHHPEKVKALILHRPAWLDKPQPDNLMILKRAMSYQTDRHKKNSDFEKESEFISIKNSYPLAGKSILGVFGELQQDDLPTVINSMVNDAPFQSMEELKSIKCPVLVVSNDHDPLHPYHMAEKIHEFIPQSQLVKTTSNYIDAVKYAQEVRTAVSKFIKSI